MIAYLNTEYPSLSHTFIEREIRAVRACGVKVQPFSVRKPSKHGTLGGAHASAADETVYLLDSSATLMKSLLVACLTGLAGVIRALVASQHLAPPGLASRFRHLVYAVEGIRLAKEMQARNIQHVHVHMANNGAAVALLATKFDPQLEYSLTIHGSAEFFHVDTWTLGDKVDHARFVRCISNFCKAQVMTWSSPSSWPNMHVVHCGVDLAQFDSSTPPPTDQLRLVTIGRFHPIKGYPLLLEACAMLSQEGIPWSLTMIGDGQLRGIIEAEINKHNLHKDVTLTGAVSAEDLPQHITEANVLVISSFMEGVPVVLMEAMAMGRPVLSTQVGGIPELIEEGASGVLVPPGSVDALLDGLQRLHVERESYADMGQVGREKIHNEFNIEGTGREMTELFKQYVGDGAFHGASEGRDAL